MSTPVHQTTSSPHLKRQVLEHIDYLIGAWPALVTLSTPGSTRRGSTGRRAVSEAQRAHAAMLAMQERLDARIASTRPGAVRGTGPVPAPAALGVLDLLARFVATAADVAEVVTQAAGVDRAPAVESSWTDPRPYLQLARAWVSPAHQADPMVLPRLRGWLGPLCDDVARELGEVHDGQLLDALCPWCGGRTEHGDGERTLVVYASRERRHVAADAEDQVAAKVGARAADEGPVIVCRGVYCEPPAQDCGTRVGDRPAWPEREWEWLAKRLVPIGSR